MKTGVSTSLRRLFAGSWGFERRGDVTTAILTIASRPVFNDLYDAISVLWSYRWPETMGEVYRVAVERARDPDGRSLQLCLAYKFSIGDDGPYTGESIWSPPFRVSDERVLAARSHLRVGHPVLVCYRPDDPAVSKLDKCVWQIL
jgi:hypothetical protein